MKQIGATLVKPAVTMNAKLYKIFAVCIMLNALGTVYSQTTYAEQRKTMVEHQLKNRGIIDKATLKAMATIPRESFVPDSQKPFAYQDRPLRIGEGQTISQPYIVAFMTQALRLKQTDRVLEVGTGSGYQAAVLSQMVDSVYTIEIVESLAASAKKSLLALGLYNVQVKIGDGYRGWKEYAPYDAILVTAGAEYMPLYLVEQLAENGRMIIPIGPHNGVRQLVLLRKKNGKIKSKNLMAVRFVPFVTPEKQ